MNTTDKYLEESQAPNLPKVGLDLYNYVGYVVETWGGAIAHLESRGERPGHPYAFQFIAKGNLLTVDGWSSHNVNQPSRHHVRRILNPDYRETPEPVGNTDTLSRTQEDAYFAQFMAAAEVGNIFDHANNAAIAANTATSYLDAFKAARGYK